VKTLASNYLNSEVSRFNSVMATSASGTLTVGQLIQEIKTGAHKKKIDQLRSLDHGPERQQEFKKWMVAVSPSGVMHERSLVKHIGLIQVDFDDVLDPQGYKKSLFSDEHILMACISPRGNGVKALAAINPDSHKAAKDEMIAYFKKAYPSQKLDTNPSSENALMIIPSDDSILVKDGNYPLRAFMGNLVSVSAPEPQELAKDTGMQSQTQPSDIDFSETQTMSSNYTYADELKTSFRIAAERLHLVSICKQRKEAFIKANPGVKKLWEIHIERGLEIDFSRRNESLVKLVARCFHRFSKNQILFFAEAFHEIYNPFFRDSLDQHMREAENLLKSMQKSYLKDLPEEQDMYQSLSGEVQSIYRICRELALHPDKLPISYFALSGNELGKRIGVSRSIAADHLNCFSGTGIISLVEKGEVWTVGKPTKANIWKWELPLNHGH
jgi:hypothetical protein